MPGKETLATCRAKDSSEQVAIRMEAGDLVERATSAVEKATMRDRSKQGGNQGMRVRTDHGLRILREAYDQAMKTGGDDGRITALAVMRAADRLGIDTGAIVDDHRRDIHRRRLEEMVSLQRAGWSIPSGGSVAVNPFGKDGRRNRSSRVGTYSGNRAAVVPSSSGQLFPKKKRRPSWK